MESSTNSNRALLQAAILSDLEAVGTPCGHDSDECALHRATHSDCGGCEFDLGCKKFLAIIGVFDEVAKLPEPLGLFLAPLGVAIGKKLLVAKSLEEMQQVGESLKGMIQ